MNMMQLDNLMTAKLKTVKAKMIREAIADGTSSRGNHTMVCETSDHELTVTMSYRGTPIIAATLEMENKGPSWTVDNIDAGEYESTPATIRQRRDFLTSVLEIKEVR